MTYCLWSCKGWLWIKQKHKIHNANKNGSESNYTHKQKKNIRQLPLEWWFGFSATPGFICQLRCNLMVWTHLPVKLYISAQKTNTSYTLPLYIQPTPQACILFSANHGIRMRPVFRMVLHVYMLILRGKGGEGMKTNWSRRKEEGEGGKGTRCFRWSSKTNLSWDAQLKILIVFFLAGFSEGDVRDLIWPGVQFLCASHVCFITSIWKNCKWCQSYLKLNNIHL